MKPQPVDPPRPNPLLLQGENQLLESAPLAWSRAPRLCHKDRTTGEDCAWIHGFWQYLRVLGLASTPGLHSQFFLEALQDRAVQGASPKVLISGAADYAMLDLVVQARQADNAGVDITVVDRCETPLMLNRWFAERAGVAVTTMHRDIFDYTGSRAFDAVCTHSFLSEMPPARWPQLLEKWRQLLRPGGVVVTINRLRADAGPGPRSFTPQEATLFRDMVTRRARDLGERLKVDASQLAGAAELYVARRRTYAPRSRDQLADLFEKAGFKVDTLLHGPVIAGARADVSGPTTPGNADYARLVARRL
jgi:SAM-dependent methyltransferase